MKEIRLVANIGPGVTGLVVTIGPAIGIENELDTEQEIVLEIVIVPETEIVPETGIVGETARAVTIEEQVVDSEVAMMAMQVVEVEVEDVAGVSDLEAVADELVKSN